MTIDPQDYDVTNDVGGMTVIGVSRLIGHCQHVGVLARLTDQQEAIDQVRSWERVLPRDMPLQFALAIADTWGEPRHITPIAIAARWQDHSKAVRAAQPTTPISEQACAWARVCRCTHTECIHGQIAGDLSPTVVTVQGDRGQTRERATLAVVWCPTCWDARNVIRQDKGKEPRAVGDVTP